MIAVFSALAMLPGAALTDEPDASRTEIDAAAWTFSSLETKKGESWGHALAATDKNGRGVGFRCFNGNLLAAIALDSGDVMAALVSSGRQRAVRVYVSIDDAEPELQDWVLFVRHRVIVVADHKITRALYNASVRRKPINIDPRRHGDGVYVYETPPPDPTAFAAFMERCKFSGKTR